MVNPSVTLSLALDDKATPQLQAFRRSFEPAHAEAAAPVQTFRPRSLSGFLRARAGPCGSR